MISHETNTFSPVPTPLARFMAGGKVLTGDAAITAYRGTDTVMGGLLQAATEVRAAIVVPVAAAAWPSGPVEDEAFDVLGGLVCAEAARGGFDGILLDLHGAMVTRKFEDAEGELLRRIREVDASTPVGIALDMHANLSSSIVRHASVIVGYHTYPHVDMHATGHRVATLLLRTIAGEIQPVMDWASVPMLTHVMRQSTDDEPNRTLQRRCAELTRGSVLAASVFTGFPHADVRNAGLSALVITDNSLELAEHAVEQLLQSAWSDRTKFEYSLEPLSESVARAKRAASSEGSGPVVMLDHFDNAASGGTMDTTMVLAEAIRQGLQDVVMFAIYDPHSVELAISAGIGNHVTVSLGGKIAMPMLRADNPPLTVSGVVQTISDGTFRYRGPLDRGLRSSIGRSVVINTGSVQIAVISQHTEPDDFGCLACLGMDPLTARFLLLKSRISWRAAFKPIARDTVDCAGLGVCTSDYASLQFRRVRRPVFPLDRSTALVLDRS
jgi:microcystin degradation protein MlrC